MHLVFGIAGHSGAGKTTLIESLLPRLAARGLRVGVLKHDAHRLHLDREGKDTARFFDAGAAMVCAHDPGQWFVRARAAAPVPLAEVLVGLPADLDLVLVEGHKGARIPKLLLEHPGPRGPDPGSPGHPDPGSPGHPDPGSPGHPDPGSFVLATLPWGDARLALAEQLVVRWLEQAWRERPLGAAVFVGGRAAHGPAGGETALARLLEHTATWAERTVVVGDRARIRRLHDAHPVVADAPGVEGPLGGFLALLRHDPGRAWITVGCDQTDFAAAHAGWLRAARRPGAWVVLPRLGGRERPEPFGAVVEPEVAIVLERAAARGVRALHEALDGAPTADVTPPDALAHGWRSA